MCLALLAALTLPIRAHAQAVRPWMPPASDSLAIKAAQARALFHAQTTDSVSGANFLPYEIVGDLARWLIRSLGRDHIAQAPVTAAVLDSLGLDVLVRVDPALPNFVLVTVRNPDRMTSMAIAYVYWYRGNTLHQQGVVLTSGHDPLMRAWYGARPGRPYSICILDRGRDGTLGWVLLGLGSDGTYWNMVQSLDRPGADGKGQGAFVDVNGDGLPELVLWTHARPDSMFTMCRECPRPFEETILVDHEPGFVLEDTRLVPTPLTTLMLFTNLLRANNRTAAARLLRDPAKVEEALALGWGADHGRGTWGVEYGQEGENWPDWLAVRFHDAKHQLYIFHFLQREGRWIIQDWIPVKASKPAEPTPPPVVPGGARKP